MEYIIILVLILFSALFSGLTLGFFSLNKDDLERKAKLGDKRARKVYSLRRNGNQLLCTLLIGNVAVNSALSIFLGNKINGVLAGVLATALIVVFGEIIPQATFSRFALKIGASLSWLVRIMIFILWPVCWPIAALLDRILGDELPVVYSKHELIKLIEDHEDRKESDIDADEERILKGALSFSDKRVRDIMTPRPTMYVLEHDRMMTKKLITEIANSGHSRIPVYKENRDEMVGVLYVKDLIKNNWEKKTVEELARKKVYAVDIDKKLDELMNDFKKIRHHLFVVMNKYGSVAGVVTIEDLIEEILGQEIVDEYDKYEDMQKVAEDRMKEKMMKQV